MVRSADRRLRRRKRRQQFETFRDLMAERWFHRLAAADPRHEYFGVFYSFYVIKGGGKGGKDTRRVEVFYGNRPVDQKVDVIETTSGLPRSQIRLVTESGAALEYERTDRGTVFCILRPARSEGYSAKETGLVLAHIQSPANLQSPAVIESHWQALMSYFECTALDGDARWSDVVRVSWLRFTRTLIVDGVVQPLAWQVALIQTVKWALTVGLSGAILLMLQWSFGAPAVK